MQVRTIRDFAQLAAEMEGPTVTRLCWNLVIGMTVVAPAVMAGQAKGASTALPPNVTQAMVQQGDVLFHGQGKCFKCHGSDAKGTPKAPGLTTPKKWINIGGSYDQIVQVVTNGVPEPKEHPAPMPAKGKANLSDDDVHAVSAYVWSISH